MKVILHIGMGKTGTTSIQQTLAKNSVNLQRQNLDYLGMWFGFVSPEFDGFYGQNKFFGSNAEELKKYAQKLIEVLRLKEAETGVSRYLLSNESLYEQISSIAPFIAELKSEIDVELIAYVRDPRDWLPSAYSQWGIYHKTRVGAILPYAQMARQLVNTYGLFPLWNKMFGDILTVREFKKGKNVVDDFSEFLNVDLDIPERRNLERLDLGEGVLRAVYNNRFNESKHPSEFNSAFRNMNFSQSLRISDIVKNSFTYDSTDEIIAEKFELFDFIRNSFGIDLLGSSPPVQKEVDFQYLRDRMLDHVLNIVMQQADQIMALEQKMALLQKTTGESNSPIKPE